MIKLPDKTRLRGIAHPSDDARAGFEHFRVTALIHRAIRLVICQLSFADEIRQVCQRAVALGDDFGILIAFLGALGQVMFGPVVIDHFPIFFRHHAVDGFQRGNGNAADFGLENFIGAECVIILRRSPAIRTMRKNTATGGGTRLIQPLRFQLRHQFLERLVNRLRRITFIARAPDGDGWMVAETKNFVAHVGDVSV